MNHSTNIIIYQNAKEKFVPVHGSSFSYNVMGSASLYTS